MDNNLEVILNLFRNAINYHYKNNSHNYLIAFEGLDTNVWCRLLFYSDNKSSYSTVKFANGSTNILALKTLAKYWLSDLNLNINNPIEVLKRECQ